MGENIFFIGRFSTAEQIAAIKNKRLKFYAVIARHNRDILDHPVRPESLNDVINQLPNGSFIDGDGQVVIPEGQTVLELQGDPSRTILITKSTELLFVTDAPTISAESDNPNVTVRLKDGSNETLVVTANNTVGNATITVKARAQGRLETTVTVAISVVKPVLRILPTNSFTMYPGATQAVTIELENADDYTVNNKRRDVLVFNKDTSIITAGTTITEGTRYPFGYTDLVPTKDGVSGDMVYIEVKTIALPATQLSLDKQSLTITNGLYDTLEVTTNATSFTSRSLDNRCRLETRGNLITVTATSVGSDRIEITATAANSSPATITVPVTINAQVTDPTRLIVNPEAAVIPQVNGTKNVTIESTVGLSNTMIRSTNASVLTSVVSNSTLTLTGRGAGVASINVSIGGLSTSVKAIVAKPAVLVDNNAAPLWTRGSGARVQHNVPTYVNGATDYDAIVVDTDQLTYDKASRTITTKGTLTRGGRYRIKLVPKVNGQAQPEETCSYLVIKGQ